MVGEIRFLRWILAQKNLLDAYLRKLGHQNFHFNYHNLLNIFILPGRYRIKTTKMIHFHMIRHLPFEGKHLHIFLNGSKLLISALLCQNVTQNYLLSRAPCCIQIYIYQLIYEKISAFEIYSKLWSRLNYFSNMMILIVYKYLNINLLFILPFTPNLN